MDGMAVGADPFKESRTNQAYYQKQKSRESFTYPKFISDVQQSLLIQNKLLDQLSEII